MAKQGFKAMDSDMHVFEPHDLWDRYIDPEFKDRAPKGLQRDFRDLGVEVEGKILPIPRRPENSEPQGTTALAPSGEDSRRGRRATSMAVSQVMAGQGRAPRGVPGFPTRVLSSSVIDGLDPELAAPFPRLQRLALRLSQRPDRAWSRVGAWCRPKNVDGGGGGDKRTVTEKGFRGVFMRPNQTNGLCWSDPYYDPLWEVCQSLDIPVGFHEAGRVYQPQPAISQFIPSFSMFNTLSFPLANMFACADMIYGGVMERFPKLRVAFLEGNCSWLPWLLYRMGDYMESVGKAEYPDLKLEPLEYFQRQCFGAVECDEITAKHIPEFGLEDNVVFSTDYPHLDVKYPHSLDTFLEMPFSDESKRKYLWDNCARLYNMGQ